MRRTTALAGKAILLAGCVGLLATGAPASRSLTAAYDYDPALPLEATADEPKTEGEFVTQRVVFASAYGESVSALLVRPVGVKKPPVLLAMHGLACNKDDARNWAQIVGSRGIAVFAIDMPYHGERATQDADWHVFRDPRLGPICMRRTVQDNLRALDYLRTRQDLDVRAIPLLGASMGANLGGIVAALDSGVAGACLISGSATPGPEPGTYVPLRDPRKADLDVTNFLAGIAPRPVLVMTGDADPGVPVAYGEALYAAAAEPKELFIYRGGHVPKPEIMEGNGGARVIRRWVKEALYSAVDSGAGTDG